MSKPECRRRNVEGGMSKAEYPRWDEVTLGLLRGSVGSFQQNRSRTYGGRLHSTFGFRPATADLRHSFVIRHYSFAISIVPSVRGGCLRDHRLATAANAASAASTVRWMQSSSCAVLTNHVSNALGGNTTPRSSISLKKAANASVSCVVACS